MKERLDVVVLGGGPGGEVAVNALLKVGRRVALIENTVRGASARTGAASRRRRFCAAPRSRARPSGRRHDRRPRAGERRRPSARDGSDPRRDGRRRGRPADSWARRGRLLGHREATDLAEIPESIVCIGGGVVGIDLGQFLVRFGSRVTIVRGPDRLADREAEEIGDAPAGILEAGGVEPRLVSARRVSASTGARRSSSSTTGPRPAARRSSSRQ